MIKKILVMGMNYIGDTLFTTPLIRSIKAHYKNDCIIDIVNGARGIDILKNNKDIDNIIIRPTDKKDYASYIEKLEQSSYEIAFVANTSFISAYDAYRAKIDMRIGLNSDMRGLFLTKKIKYRKYSEHIIDNMLYLLQPLNIKIQTIKPIITLSEGEDEFGKNIMKNFDKSLIVHAGATRASKRYPTDKFAEVINKFYEKTKIPTILIGSKDDVSFSNDIQSLCSSGAIALNFTAKLSMREMLGVMKYGYIFLGGDSAPLHIANAFDLFTVGIYGDTLPLIYGARGDKAINISAREYCSNTIKRLHCTYIKRGCKSIECLKSIEPASVYQVMIDIIS